MLNVIFTRMENQAFETASTVPSVLPSSTAGVAEKSKEAGDPAEEENMEVFVKKFVDDILLNAVDIVENQLQSSDKTERDFQSDALKKIPSVGSISNGDSTVTNEGSMEIGSESENIAAAKFTHFASFQ
jgi:hypothetical protein